MELIPSPLPQINTLGIPVLALQAWDSALIDSGEARYLVLLINFGANYPVNPDDGTRGEVQIRVGISPHYKPSKAAIAAAFRSASSHSYTEGEFEAISLSVPLDSLFSDKFQEILLRRRQNPGIGWAGAEHHCLALIKSDGTLNASECKAADLAEKEISGSYTVCIHLSLPLNYY
jgi:ubiquitin-conjugating enzyme E2 Q